MDGHVFAYNPPKSTEQQAYTQARIAQLAAQRREQRRSLEICNDQASASTPRSLSSATSSPSKSRSAGAGYRIRTSHRRDDHGDDKDATPANTGHIPTDSEYPDANPLSQPDGPFERRHGRRYLRNLHYPLPCDLVEIQRQNLRTLLGCRVFGKPVCSPHLEHAVPRKVLDLGCGSGYWSAMAHEYFRARGHPDVSFTGLDAAPVATDLAERGVNWRFVQHDVHRLPWPFEDDEFDLIVARDLSLALPMRPHGSSRHLGENIRVLREGGTLEIWESDLVVRALLPHSSAPAGPPATQEAEVAERTATFPMTAGAPFAPARNKHLVEANAWIAEALDRRRLSPVPCARIAQLLIQEPDLGSIGVRRVAVPLSELPWERGDEIPAATVDAALSPSSSSPFERRPSSQSSSSVVDSGVWVTSGGGGGGDRRTSRTRAQKTMSGSSSLSSASTASSSAASGSSGSSSSSALRTRDHHHCYNHHHYPRVVLTPDQLALRQTALTTVLQMIESLEPLLKEVSGKNTKEWSTWWASMMTELTDPTKASLSGECLELGVWWATKTSEEGLY